jgi:hypothetical protein
VWDSYQPSDESPAFLRISGQVMADSVSADGAVERLISSMISTAATPSSSGDDINGNETVELIPDENASANRVYLG